MAGTSSPNNSHPRPSDSAASTSLFTKAEQTALASPRDRIQKLQEQVAFLQGQAYYYRRILREIAEEYDDAMTFPQDAPPFKELASSLAHKAKRSKRHGLWDYHMSTFHPEGFVNDEQSPEQPQQ